MKNTLKVITFIIVTYITVITIGVMNCSQEIEVSKVVVEKTKNVVSSNAVSPILTVSQPSVSGQLESIRLVYEDYQIENRINEYIENYEDIIFSIDDYDVCAMRENGELKVDITIANEALTLALDEAFHYELYEIDSVEQIWDKNKSEWPWIMDAVGVLSRSVAEELSDEGVVIVTTTLADYNELERVFCKVTNLGCVTYDFFERYVNDNREEINRLRANGYDPRKEKTHD